MRSAAVNGKRHCASCNGLKCLIFGGPDGAYTLCNTCNKFYVDKKLRLYHTKAGVSARASPGALRVAVKRFNSAVHNKSQSNRMKPVVRKATKEEHNEFPLPPNKHQRNFILSQAALVDGDDLEMEEDEEDEEDEESMCSYMSEVTYESGSAGMARSEDDSGADGDVWKRE
eukprot:GFKZ01013072.1.p1 GENE.GFKZ01013072.1~~GFKZ01013072.1.p1  ORF type:complete len:171 (-),score=34.15 GFKZ01013072.1:322-834(-)